MIEDSSRFFSVLQSLIDAWCDRRCLSQLRHILAAYPMVSGLRDDEVNSQSLSRTYVLLLVIKSPVRSYSHCKRQCVRYNGLRGASKILHQDPCSLPPVPYSLSL